MTMPKGHKSPHGYASIKSIPGAMDYRSIAEEMTISGDKMNHATARNVFLAAMRKFAAPILELYDMPTNSESIMRTAKDPRFQESIVDILSDVTINDSKESSDAEIEI